MSTDDGGLQIDFSQAGTFANTEFKDKDQPYSMVKCETRTLVSCYPGEGFLQDFPEKLMPETKVSRFSVQKVKDKIF